MADGQEWPKTDRFLVGTASLAYFEMSRCRSSMLAITGHTIGFAEMGI